VKIGLIGSGGMGCELARRAVKISDVSFAASYDTDMPRAEKIAQELGGKACESLDQLLDMVDAVIIASIPSVHREHCLAAVRAGRHVFCEKPFTIYAKESQEVIDAAKQAGVKLMIGQVLRYIQPFAWILDKVRSGEIGPVLSVFVARLGGKSGVWNASWRGKHALCGGLLEEINAHELDFMRCAGGEVAGVTARLGNFHNPDIDFEDNAFVILRFQSGSLGLLHSSILCQVGGYHGRVEGAEGDIVWDRVTDTLQWRKAWGETKTHKISELGAGDPYLEELEGFVEAARTGAEPPVTGYDGMRAVALAEAARLSSQLGREVLV